MCTQRARTVPELVARWNRRRTVLAVIEAFDLVAAAGATLRKSNLAPAGFARAVMTRLLALVVAAVEVLSAWVAARVSLGKCFTVNDGARSTGALGFLGSTEAVLLLELPTGRAITNVARCLARVVAALEEVLADAIARARLLLFLAAAKFVRRSLARARAKLAWKLTRRTRPGVTRKRAKMRALLSALATARVSTAVRRVEAIEFGIRPLAAKALVGPGWVRVDVLASRTPPTLLLSRRRHPFVDAMRVEHRPTSLTGPNLGLVVDVRNANHTIVFVRAQPLNVFACEGGGVFVGFRARRLSGGSVA